MKKRMRVAQRYVSERYVSQRYDHNEMKKKQRYCTLSLRSIILVLLLQKFPSFTLACYLSVLTFLPLMNVVENYLETTVFASFYCIFKYFTTG